MSKTLAGGAAFAAAAFASMTAPAGAQSGPGVAPAYAAPDAGTQIVRNPKTGLVSWMYGDVDQPIAKATARADGLSLEQAAAAFLGGQSAAFGLRDGAAELSTMKALDDGAGRGFVRFQQNHRGVPVLGAELTVQLDGARDVVSVNGRSVGDLDVQPQPSVTAADALKTAIASTSRRSGLAAGALKATTPRLAIHDPRIMGGPAASPALVWRIEVSGVDAPEVSDFVLVDARNGRIAVQFSQTMHASPPPNATQSVCDSANTVSKVPCLPGDAVASPGTSAVPDVKSAFDFAEATYDFYARRFNRNSLDAAGLKLVSTVRYRRSAGSDYQNAFWSRDLKQMVYGKDFAVGKDVVGHELSHGFTNFTSNLFYYYQSGAINESLSDIFGELVQQSTGTVAADRKWLLGEDLPIGAIRDMEDPPVYDQPDKMTSSLWEEDAGYFDSGGVHTNSGVGNKAAFLMTDGGTFNGKTVKGIGIDKTAAIFYRVDAFMLQSASDYADLANAMQQACADLIGKKPKSQTGKQTAEFTKKDCKQVSAAIAAVEMTKQPPTNPIPAEAAVCSGDDKPEDKLYEQFEASDPSKFKFQATDFRWELQDFYAPSNFHAYYVYGNGTFDVSLSSTEGVKIPKKAFLRFAHYDDLYTLSSVSYAGAVLEYAGSDGVWQRVTADRFLDNPYNTTVLAGTGGSLAGQQAFSGFSGGWTSSRVDLGFLSGKTVKFRFRVATDFHGAATGWMVDDVRLYTCKGKKKKDDIASAD